MEQASVLNPRIVQRERIHPAFFKSYRHCTVFRLGFILPGNIPNNEVHAKRPQSATVLQWWRVRIVRWVICKHTFLQSSVLPVVDIGLLFWLCELLRKELCGSCYLVLCCRQKTFFLSSFLNTMSRVKTKYIGIGIFCHFSCVPTVCLLMCVAIHRKKKDFIIMYFLEILLNISGKLFQSHYGWLNKLHRFK